MKHLFYKGVTYELSNGKQIRFWQDVWLGTVPLRMMLPKLYEICNDPDVKVRDCYKNGEWFVMFRRNFGESELQEWSMFLENTKGMYLNGEEDKVIWALDKSKTFTLDPYIDFSPSRVV